VQRLFEQTRVKSGRQEAAEQRRIALLEAKRRNKDEVMAELLGEHVALQKSWGDLKAAWGPQDVRDEVMDTVHRWAARSAAPAETSVLTPDSPRAGARSCPNAC